MALPMRLFLRASVQTLLCFMCFNFGFLLAYYNYGNSSCIHELDPNHQGYAELREGYHGLKHQKTFLVIAIITKPVNIERRQAIRDTWLAVPRLLRQEILPLFIIGANGLLPVDKDDLADENAKFKDLMLLPVEDSFSLLTKKVLSAFVHIDRNVHFKYLLKVDDDSFVRVADLLEELKNSNYNNGLYWGFFDGRAPVIRDEGSKWREKDYIMCDRYVPYALGGGYVLSQDLVHYLAENANYLTVFHNEDVSVGSWLGPLKVTRVHDTRFDTEFRSRGCSNRYLVTHKQSVEEMKTKQYNILSRRVMCEQEVQERKSYNYNWGVSPSKCCERTDPSLP